MKKLIFALTSLCLCSPALAEEAASGLSDIPLLTKGLIVTASGLGGVFLVLILFYLLIKIMGKLLR